MQQFKFLEGSWDCVMKTKLKDGSYAESKATWTGKYVLDGFAFQDDFRSSFGQGQVYRGTTWRTYQVEEQRWINIFLSPNDLVQAIPSDPFFTGKTCETGMCLTRRGRNQKGTYIDKFFFVAISSDSFTWYMDRSYDDGVTWLEKVTIIKAVRTN